MSEKLRTVLGHALVATIALLVIFLGYSKYHQATPYPGGQIVQGTVTAVQTSSQASSSGGRTVLCLLVASYEVGGQTYVAQTPNYSTSTCGTPRGTRIPVSYLPQNPEAGRLLAASEHTDSYLIVGAGLVMLFFVGFSFWLNYKSWTSQGA